MPKRKGLGRDISKSLEVMASLQKELKAFLDTPLKRGLHSSGMSEDGMNKNVHEAMMKAFELTHMVADLSDSIKGIKIEGKSSRFAAQRVVEGFLGVKQ